MSLLMIGRGDCHLGRTKTDVNGNVVEQSSAKWEPNDEGGCVAVCSVDPDKLEPTEAAEVFGDWDAAHYLKRVLEKLGPGRPANVPDFKAILERAMCDGVNEDFFCEYCQRYGYDCRDCIVTEWMEEIKQIRTTDLEPN